MQRNFETMFRCGPKIIEGGTVQPQRPKCDEQAAEYGQREQPCIFIRNSSPEEEGNQQQCIHNHVDQPHTLAVYNRLPNVTHKALHAEVHFTSSVRGSLVAKYEG